MLNNWLKFKQLLNGSPCFLCEATTNDNSGFCATCLADLPWLSASHCPQCALYSNGQICGACIKNPPFFDATRAAFDYEFPLDSLLQSYKYAGNLKLSKPFKTIINQQLNCFEMAKKFDFILPMPMHAKSLQARGFNQSLEIARDLPNLKPNAAQRIKWTPPQASLPIKQRASNIKGVFEICAEVRGKRVAIIDDVMTTGASLNELAKMLKKAGAIYVECWVLARTQRH